MHAVERVALMTGKRVLTRADFESNADMRETAPRSALEGDWLTLDEVERLMVQRAMQQSGRNVTQAAELLGLSRAALYRRLTKHGLTE
jgi:transcriptional regulator of acetoin/glycerol metabolism